MEVIEKDLRMLEKGCYYKVLDSQQYKDDVDEHISIEDAIDYASEFVYIKILTIAVSKKKDCINAKVGDSIPFIDVDSNAEYLDNKEFCLDYELEVWGDFQNSSFHGALAEYGEYEKVTDLSFMNRLKKYS